MVCNTNGVGDQPWSPFGDVFSAASTRKVVFDSVLRSGGKKPQVLMPPS